ncbi:MAG: sulfatase [Candidatus Zipacnadales bacterium]
MNVFFISADSFRVDHLGCYGNEWIQTPHLDALATESTVFENAYSENMPTLPNRQALFTGRFGLPFRGWQALDMKYVLAEALWDKGLRTCLISDTYHMLKPGMLYSRGFEEVHFIRGQEYDPMLGDCDAPVDLDRYFKDTDNPQREFHRHGTEVYLRNRAHWRTDADHFVAQCVRETLAWLDRQEAAGRKDGLFLWLDCFDPHEPWDPMPPFDTMYGPLLPGGRQLANPIPAPVEGYLTDEECTHIRQQYGGLCSVVDKWLGVLLEELRARGYFENTLLIFTSDHGEPLGKGQWGHGIMRKCRPWPYEELAHIPLFIRHPQFGQGRRVAGFVQPPDLTATILESLGLPQMPGTHGQSLLPMVRGEEESIHDFAVSGFHQASWSIRTVDHTLILWRPELDSSRIPAQSVGASSGPAPKRRAPELYLRREDPYELNNIVAEYPEEAIRLELKLRQFMDGLTWQ